MNEIKYIFTNEEIKALIMLTATQATMFLIFEEAKFTDELTARKQLEKTLDDLRHQFLQIKIDREEILK